VLDAGLLLLLRSKDVIVRLFHFCVIHFCMPAGYIHKSCLVSCFLPKLIKNVYGHNISVICDNQSDMAPIYSAKCIICHKMGLVFDI